MWQARFYQALPQITEQYPKARWLFLTLTVKNPPIGELRDTLAHMNKAWQRLIQRKALGDIQGWIRTTEVTKPDDSGYCHPHFHVLLMVKPSYFSRGYIKQSKWVELWQSCLQVGYEPNVDVRTVKHRKPAEGEDADQVRAAALHKAVQETLKYSTKPADMVSDEAWFLELTRQTHKLRFMASGGALKDVLKVDQESDEELVMAEGEADGEDDGSRIGFTWRPTSQTYRRSKKLDRGPTGPKQVDGLKPPD